MDGAITEQGQRAREATLRRLAWFAAKRWAAKLATSVRYEDGVRFSTLERTNAGWRGVPSDDRDLPAWLWDRFLEDSDSAGIDDDDLDAMRAPFCADAATELDGYGFDCR